MKRASLFLIIFSLFYFPFFTHASGKYSATDLTGVFEIAAFPEDKSFDAKINSAQINNSGVLSISLELTGVREESFLTKPGYFIYTKQEFDSNTAIQNSISLDQFPLKMGEKKLVEFSKTLSPNDYVIVIYDGSTNTTYQPKQFSVTFEVLPQPTNPPVDNPSGNTQNPNNGTETPENPTQDSMNVTPQFLSNEDKLGNPFKQLGSFEKIVTAFLSGIVIPVGIPILAGFIMYSGFLFVHARGNPTELKNAKEVAKWTLLGGLIMLGSVTIVKFLQSTFDNITNGL